MHRVIDAMNVIGAQPDGWWRDRRAAIERLSTCVAALDAYEEERASDPELEAVLAGARDAFKAALDDDLNVSGALGAVFVLVRELNKRVDARMLSTTDARRAAAALRDFAGSDRLRDELAQMGVAVDDTRDGQRWRVTRRGGND